METQRGAGEAPWTRDELDYANIVRRQIVRTGDALSGAINAEEVWYAAQAVRSLSSLLDPYKPDGFQEELDAIGKEEDGLLKEADERYTTVAENRHARATVRREYGHRLFRKLLALAKSVGILLEAEVVEGERPE